MDNPGMDSLMDTVRRINEVGRRARSGEPQVEDYLRAVGSEPRTEWFTNLLREKNEELLKERDRSDRLANALRTWYRSNDQASDADVQLIKALRSFGVVEQ
jgi:hypothetical protein